MKNFKVRKGNFFNQLTNSFDRRIIDGNQYDLELTINDKKYYYRVRFIDGALEAYPITLKEEEFVSHLEYNNMEEISSFFKTDFYRNEFQFHKEIEAARKILAQRNAFNNPDYFSFVKRISKKNQLKGQTLYDFSLPANERRTKRGVLSYDVSIECANNFYYLFFVKEAAEKNYPQSDTEIYFIYKRNDFLRTKKLLEDKILEICIEKEMPINLTSLIYIISDGNLALLDAIYKDIMKVKSKQDVEALMFSKYYPALAPSLKFDSALQSEFKNHITTSKEDIEYHFARKRI